MDVIKNNPKNGPTATAVTNADGRKTKKRDNDRKIYRNKLSFHPPGGYNVPEHWSPKTFTLP